MEREAADCVDRVVEMSVEQALEVAVGCLWLVVEVAIAAVDLGGIADEPAVFADETAAVDVELEVAVVGFACIVVAEMGAAAVLLLGLQREDCIWVDSACRHTHFAVAAGVVLAA